MIVKGIAAAIPIAPTLRAAVAAAAAAVVQAALQMEATKRTMKCAGVLEERGSTQVTVVPKVKRSDENRKRRK